MILSRSQEELDYAERREQDRAFGDGSIAGFLGAMWRFVFVLALFGGAFVAIIDAARSFVHPY